MVTAGKVVTMSMVITAGTDALLHGSHSGPGHCSHGGHDIHGRSGHRAGLVCVIVEVTHRLGGQDNDRFFPSFRVS